MTRDQAADESRRMHAMADELRNHAAHDRSDEIELVQQAIGLEHQAQELVNTAA